MHEKKSSLLFIPDITGFTQFVNQTEIEHSQHIISELLEIIIDSNTLDLEVSEIEGDAVLFFKHNHIPSTSDIANQVSRTFLAFHNHLKSYETRRICSCGACVTATNLSLKFIIHQGEIGFTTVKEKKKPFGPELILAHRLLKNNIDHNEYLLFTSSFNEDLDKDKLHQSINWLLIRKGQYHYDGIGDVNFNFADLSSLRQYIVIPPPLQDLIPSKNPIINEVWINNTMDEVYEKLSNFEYRLAWNKGINELEYEKGKVNRVGTRHRCVINNGQEFNFETISDQIKGAKIVYGERILEFPLAKEIYNLFILTPMKGGVAVKVETHFKPKPLLGWIMFQFIKRKFSANLNENLYELKAICEHPESILISSEA